MNFSDALKDIGRIPTLPVVYSRTTAFRNYPGALPIDKFHQSIDNPVITIIAKFLTRYSLLCGETSRLIHEKYWVRWYFAKLIMTCSRIKYYYDQRNAAFPVSNTRRRALACEEGAVSSQYKRSMGFSRRDSEDNIFQITCVACGLSTWLDPVIKIEICPLCSRPHCVLHRESHRHICNAQ